MRLIECVNCARQLDHYWQRCACSVGQEALQVITPLGLVPLLADELGNRSPEPEQAAA